MKKEIKILVATGIYPPDIGGPATYSKLLHDELPKMYPDIQVKVISFGEVRHFPKIIRHIVYFFKLLIRSRGCNIIFAQDTVSVGLPTLLASKLTFKRFFLRVPGDYAWEQSVQRFGVKEGIDEFQNKKYGFRVEFLRSVQKMVANGAEKVIAPSLYFQDLVSKWVKNSNKVYAIYNGIDLSAIDSKLSLSNYSKESRSIISVGRLVSWKGFSELIDAMELLPDWKLYIVGSGPEEFLLKNKAVKFKDRIIFLGQMKREDLIKKMQSCDVFVLNTSFESFSFQIVEAMAAGIPVVSTMIGNIREIITDGEDGLLVEPNDTDAIAQAVKRLSGDSVLREKIIRNAKEKSRMFSIDNTINKLVELIK